MSEKTNEPRRWTRKAAATAGAVVVAGAAVAAWAQVSAADTPSTSGSRDKAAEIVQVSGQLTPQDQGGTVYKLAGELIGTWLFPAEEAQTFYYKENSRFYQRGVEYFEGCVNTDGNKKCGTGEPTGRLRGEYLYWASYDSTGRLVEGGCTHMLNGGKGAFVGVRGLLRMTDVYSATTPAGSTAIYQGEVILNAVDEPAVDTWPKPAAAGARTAPAGFRPGC